MQFGSPETTTGGNALKYFASVRLDIRRIATIKEGDRPVGSRTRVKVAKNKCAPPFVTAEFEIGFGRGIDREAEILDAGLGSGAIAKNGSWFSCGGERMGQGRSAALQWLREHPDECDAIVRATLGDSSDTPAVAA